VSSILGVGAVFGGVHSLLFQDRRWRWLAWSVLLGLAAGWAGYFTVVREPGSRIALEVVSVLALIVAALRVRWLVRTGAARPLLFAPMGRALRWFAPVFGSVWVVAAKIWLLAMLVMEWRGKAHFNGLEYAVVSAILAGLIVLRVRSVSRARAGFSTLASLANTSPATTCPLGFGCETIPAAGPDLAARPAAVVAGHIAAFDDDAVEPVRRA
jgi:hypothetical protein